jgi:hypothetical protein
LCQAIANGGNSILKKLDNYNPQVKLFIYWLYLVKQVLYLACVTRKFMFEKFLPVAVTVRIQRAAACAGDNGSTKQD